jgi:hypothetical protein
MQIGKENVRGGGSQSINFVTRLDSDETCYGRMKPLIERLIIGMRPPERLHLQGPRIRRGRVSEVE